MQVIICRCCSALQCVLQCVLQCMLQCVSQCMCFDTLCAFGDADIHLYVLQCVLQYVLLQCVRCSVAGVF